MPERDENLKTRLEQCSTALQSSEARFRNIITRSADGILIVDNAGVIRFANPAAELLFDRKADELTGEFFGSPVLAGETSELIVVSRKDARAVIEMRVVETAWEGEQAFVASLRDITDRKRAEEELRASEERLQKAISIETVGVLFFNLDGRILGANSAFEKMSSYTSEELRRIEHWKNLTAPEFWTVTIDTAERLAIHGKTPPYEKQMIRKDGSRWWGLFNPARLNDSGGSSDCIEFIIDITERKKAEEEIKELNAQLKIANRDLEAFNYTVAHDLRKPLTVINGYCQVLSSFCEDKLDDQCKSYVREAYEGTRRMNRLIDDLLNFSQAGHAEPKRELVNLSGLAQEVASELKQAEPERRVIFLIPDEIPADADPALLRIVLSNLFGNAWKYTGNHEEGIIEFGMKEIRGRQAYFVRDNGIGFDPSGKEKLFEPFQRLESGNVAGGLGIGLATVARIIQRHHGEVWAEGEPGKGATFFFTVGEKAANHARRGKT